LIRDKVDRYFVNWQTIDMTDADLFRALANDRRLQILAWLKDPVAHFPPQRDGDLIGDGVCGQSIAEKLGINASTLSEHMRVLQGCDLVTAKRIKQWTFYRRNADRLRALAALVDDI
jgi:DNA-binding transcriptional ArsR family regulator